MDIERNLATKVNLAQEGIVHLLKLIEQIKCKKQSTSHELLAERQIERLTWPQENKNRECIVEY